MMLETVLTISLATSVIIALLLCLSPLLDKRYSAMWRYFVWLIIAVRLVIPVNIRLPQAPVRITMPEQVVVIRAGGPTAVDVMTEEERSEAARYEASSLNYAPVMSLSELFTCIWIAGTAVFLIVHIAGYIRFRLRIRPCLRDTERNNVKICPGISAPLAVGFIRPVILLPDTVYTDEELGFILAHEVMHIKRGDLWYKLLLVAANAVHWFNPLVYLMVNRAERDLEYCCDYMVVKNKDIEYRKKYSMTILKHTRNKGRDGGSK